MTVEEPEKITDIYGNPLALNVLRGKVRYKQLIALTDSEELSADISSGFALYPLLLGVGLNILLGGML